MSLVASQYDGPKVSAPSKPVRRKQRELSLLWASRMYVRKLQGYKTPEIAREFKMTRQNVNYHFRKLSKPAKEAITKRFNRGELGLI